MGERTAVTGRSGPRTVERDARGILDPRTGLTRFRLDRHAPSASVSRFVDRYWVASWDLTGRAPHVQRVLPHPVVNVVFHDGGAAVYGPATRVLPRRLEGTGWALGVMFRPAGFRPLLGRPLSTIVDAVLPWSELFDADLPAHDAPAPLITWVDDLLAARLPARRHPAEDTADLVDRLAADPSAVSVSALARREGVGVRLLQRRFADHVGLSPKTVIRRYRIYEAAERARSGERPDWGALAAELGYSDQSHLTREFTSVIGMSPGRYAALGRRTPGG
ncbi:helix-turn-helix transcriptional regulator [Nocardiopsis sp. FIRDI 009]|uniref:helix-turn-helix transcriptional regulator n=1 Tax=Nocardiopsis sp. FIRDI 009 TaxID=714197 RepID=UPI001E60F2EC|nr:helix-turn-helix transcriptional regulator [Nocardiopsis sp. FIRDI 009]